MDRVFESGAAASPPSAPASPSTGYPTKGNPSTGTAATRPGEYWYHMITEELLAVIAAAGLTPDHTNVAQLLAALDALYVNESQFTGANQSLAANGWQKLPGGLIVQWGYKATTAGEGPVTFPLAFPAAVFAVLATDVTSGTYTTADMAAVNTPTLTGFNVSTRTDAGSAATSAAFWFAIGK